MTVFKTFLKILKKNKFIIIMYTVILLGITLTNMSNSDTNTNFIATKPDILIINNDTNEGITKNMIEYFDKKCNIKNIENNEEAISDALFYRDINYIITIPESYHTDFLQGKNPEIKIQSTGDYNASLAEMQLNRYLNVANIYQKTNLDEEKIIQNINETLEKETKVEVTSKLDEISLSKAAFYFDFESYSILACLIYIICLIMAVFNDVKIKKRTLISSVDYKKNNRILLLSNYLYAFIIWVFYTLASFIIVGKIMFTIHGLILIINSLIFTACATALAFLISSIITNKNAVNGIVNVVALGSSFLCGAFVPQEWLPDIVLKISHIIPTYYYINNNDSLKTIEVFNTHTLRPIIINMIIMVIFIIIFIILTNIISNKKRKIA